MDIGDAHLGQGILGRTLALILDLGLAALVLVLDSFRMDATVLHQFGQGQPRRLASDRVKGGQQHRSGMSSIITFTPVTDSNARSCGLPGR